ncbi:hypothetical protein MYVALT_G_02290 [Candidatus Vallotia tarda]|uniref:Uncharacterized protein n=1 Tax=Candidatus Vallotiella hemipterorum TaxID=1177213 RepID=A0A916JTW9_9BURK|nr:hypothetical protein MYVALT_G_02290 [Candidatus Vallotia tarda]
MLDVSLWHYLIGGPLDLSLKIAGSAINTTAIFARLYMAIAIGKLGLFLT